MAAKTEHKIIIKPRKTNVDTWVHLKRLYVQKRGSDAGRSGKAIPRTTNADVEQLSGYFDGAMKRSEQRLYFVNDKDKASRKRWVAAKKKIDGQLRDADRQGIYPENEWFWQVESIRAAQYLDALAFAPTRFELMTEAVDETLEEHKQRIQNAADKAIGVGGDLVDVIKRGAWILGGVVAAAVIVPTAVRAFTRRDRD